MPIRTRKKNLNTSHSHNLAKAHVLCSNTGRYQVAVESVTTHWPAVPPAVQAQLNTSPGSHHSLTCHQSSSSILQALHLKPTSGLSE